MCIRLARPVPDKLRSIYLVSGCHVTATPDLGVCAQDKRFVVVQLSTAVGLTSYAKSHDRKK